MLNRNSLGKKIANNTKSLENFWRWFGNSKVVDKKGRPLVVYHGSTARFKVFDPKRGFNVDAIYHSAHEHVASHYSASSDPVLFDKDLPNKINKMTTLKQLFSVYSQYFNTKMSVINPYGDDDDDPNGTYYRLEEKTHGFSSSSPLGYTKDGINFYRETNEGEKRTINLIDYLKKDLDDKIWVSLNSDRGGIYYDYLKMENPLIINAFKKAYHKIEFKGKLYNTESIALWALENGYDGVIIKDVLETNYETALTDDYIVFKSNQVKSMDNNGNWSLENDNIDESANKFVYFNKELIPELCVAVNNKAPTINGDSGSFMFGLMMFLEQFGISSKIIKNDNQYSLMTNNKLFDESGLTKDRSNKYSSNSIYEHCDRLVDDIKNSKHSIEPKTYFKLFNDEYSKLSNKPVIESNLSKLKKQILENTNSNNFNYVDLSNLPELCRQVADKTMSLGDNSGTFAVGLAFFLFQFHVDTQLIIFTDKDYSDSEIEQGEIPTYYFALMLENKATMILDGNGLSNIDKLLSWCRLKNKKNNIETIVLDSKDYVAEISNIVKRTNFSVSVEQYFNLFNSIYKKMSLNESKNPTNKLLKNYIVRAVKQHKDGKKVLNKLIEMIIKHYKDKGIDYSSLSKMDIVYRCPEHIAKKFIDYIKTKMNVKYNPKNLNENTCLKKIIQERLFPEIDDSVYHEILELTSDGKANAFTKWVCQQYNNGYFKKDLEQGNIIPINELLHGYNENKAKLKPIMDYKTPNELENAIISVENSGYKSRADIEKEAKKGAEKIYEDKDYLVLKINTWAACKKYGSNTKWCISTNFNTKIFDAYNKNNDIYFIIDKLNPNKKYACVGNICWDEYDDKIFILSNDKEDFDRVDDKLELLYRNKEHSGLITALQKVYSNYKPDYVKNIIEKYYNNETKINGKNLNESQVILKKKGNLYIANSLDDLLLTMKTKHLNTVKCCYDKLTKKIFFGKIRDYTHWSLITVAMKYGLCHVENPKNKFDDSLHYLNDNCETFAVSMNKDDKNILDDKLEFKKEIIKFNTHFFIFDRKDDHPFMMNEEVVDAMKVNKGKDVSYLYKNPTLKELRDDGNVEYRVIVTTNNKVDYYFGDAGYWIHDDITQSMNIDEDFTDNLFYNVKTNTFYMDFTTDSKEEYDNMYKEVNASLRNDEYIKKTFGNFNFKLFSKIKIDNDTPFNESIELKPVQDDTFVIGGKDFEEEGGKIYHIMDNNVLVGKIALSDYPNGIEIEGLNIKKEFKNKGYGSKVVNMIKQKYPNVYVRSIPPALGFWKKMGLKATYNKDSGTYEGLLQESKHLLEYENLRGWNRIAGFYHLDTKKFEFFPRTTEKIEDDDVRVNDYIHNVTFKGELSEFKIVRFGIEDIPGEGVVCYIEADTKEHAEECYYTIVDEYQENLRIVRYELEYHIGKKTEFVVYDMYGDRIDESIEYAQTKNNDLVNVILKNPTIKELQEYKNDYWRVCVLKNGDFYYAKQSELVHSEIMEELVKQHICNYTDEAYRLMQINSSLIQIVYDVYTEENGERIKVDKKQIKQQFIKDREILKNTNYIKNNYPYIVFGIEYRDEEATDFFESKSDKILVEGIQEVKKYFPLINDTDFNKLIKMDPTYTGGDRLGTYGKWILSLYNTYLKDKIAYKKWEEQKKQGRVFPEPIKKSKERIEDFNKIPDLLKKSVELKFSDMRNIKSVADLYAKVKELEPKQKNASINSKVQHAIDLVKKSVELGGRIDFKNDNWIILVPETLESSHVFSQDTNWCTTASNGISYYEYLEEYGGDYFINVNLKTGDLYQFHFESEQFMDSNDKEIDVKKFIKNNKSIVPFYREYILNSNLQNICKNWYWLKPSDITEKMKIKTVENDAYLIKYIQNPSEEVQLAAVNKDGIAIEYIKNPSEKVQLAAVSRTGFAIEYIKNPSEEVQLAAVKQKPYSLTLIKNPSEKVQLASIEQIGKGWLIQHIDNPSEKVQLASVRDDVDNYKFIKNPTPKVKKYYEQLLKKKST